MSALDDLIANEAKGASASPLDSLIAQDSGGSGVQSDIPTVTITRKKQIQGFGASLSDGINDIPHQLGLTARAGLRGIGNAVGMFSDPIGALINQVPGANMLTARTMADKVGDAVGLPKPATANERIASDGAELLTPAAGISKFAGLAADGVKASAPVLKSVFQSLASNPGQQIASAGAAGLAGGYTRETGGGDGAQFLASLAGGVAGPLSMNAAMGAANGVRNAVTGAKQAVQNIANPSLPSMQIDMQVNNALRGNGMSMADLPFNVQNGIRNDVQAALKTNGDLSPAALSRLADYRLTGATPTAASLTLDPAMVSQQQNLAKLGINSKDAAAQTLGRVQNANNGQLIEGLNTLGANTAEDAFAGGQKVIGGVQNYNDRAGNIIGKLYDRAKTSDGRSAALDPQAFATKADELLTQNLRNAELPVDIRNKLNSFASGETPLTIENAEQFKTIMAKVQRGSSDGGIRDAISHVRTALDETPLLPGQPLGTGSQMAFDRARSMNRQYMAVVEKTPALQAVRDGIEPDKFVQQFVIGSGNNANTMDVAMLKNSIKSNPDAMSAVRNQITSYLKKSALNGAADEVGNFSQSAYNKALSAIGDRKLNMFFPSEDLNQLKAIGRVASYEQFQPRGAAVNNSNTAGTAMSAILDRIGNSALLSKIPFGKSLAEPVQNISIGIKSNRAMNVQNALGATPLPMPNQPSGLLLSPAMLLQHDDQRKGLLSP